MRHPHLHGHDQTEHRIEFLGPIIDFENFHATLERDSTFLLVGLVTQLSKFILI